MFNEFEIQVNFWKSKRNAGKIFGIILEHRILNHKQVFRFQCFQWFCADFVLTFRQLEGLKSELMSVRFVVLCTLNTVKIRWVQVEPKITKMDAPPFWTPFPNKQFLISFTSENWVSFFEHFFLNCMKCNWKIRQ